MSDDQAAAIIDGLNQNDQNMASLVNGIRNSARNASPRNVRKRANKRKRSNETEEKNEENQLFAEMVDAAIALQNPKFPFTKTMMSKGHSFETLRNIFDASEDEKLSLSSWNSL